jgi:hypothetical protein
MEIPSVLKTFEEFGEPAVKALRIVFSEPPSFDDLDAMVSIIEEGGCIITNRDADDYCGNMSMTISYTEELSEFLSK